MKITAISAQLRDANRVNISIDGKYRFSLDITQLTDLNIRIGREITEDEYAQLETESQFGKLYVRALEYTFMRPHSAREIRDYLWRKTRATKYKSKKTGEIKERAGVSQSVVDRVFDRLSDRGYIDDEKFARYWVENRNQTKGASQRKLTAELQAKGVDRAIIEQAMAEIGRLDSDELHKVIAKKRRRYPDDKSLIAYLARQGFRYDDIMQALATSDDDSIQ